METKYMRNKLTNIERKTIEFLAKKGPATGYDFHLGGKRTRGNREAIMSSGIWEKVRKKLVERGLIRQLEKQAALGSRGERGRRRNVYGLTFKSMHYSLSYNFVGYDKFKELVQKHRIKIPCMEESEYENVVLTASAFSTFFTRFCVALGKEGFRNLLKFIVENYPEEFFKNFIIDPLSSNKQYMGKLLLRLFRIIGSDKISDFLAKLPDDKMIDMIGEEAYKLLKIQDRKIAELNREISKIPLTKRSKMIVAKLKRLR